MDFASDIEGDAIGIGGGAGAGDAADAGFWITFGDIISFTGPTHILLTPLEGGL